MIDSNLIKISQIKNINAIYFYNTNTKFSNSNNFLGLKISYGNHETLGFDYRSEYFEKLVSKVYEVYNKEKDKRRIILFGDLTKELMKKESLEYRKEESSLVLQNQGIPSLNTLNRKILINEEYIKMLLKNILSIYFQHPMLEVEKVSGYNNKFNAVYKVEIMERDLCFFCTIENNDNIFIKINNINGKIKNIMASIKFSYEKVEVYYESEDGALIGAIIYDIEEAKAYKKILSCDEIVEFAESELEINNSEKDLLNFYFALLKLPKTNNICKTVNNCFASYDLRELEKSSNDVMVEKTSNHIFIKEDEVNIKFSKSIGFTMDDSGLLFELSQEKENITLKLVEIDEEKYVVVQRFFPLLTNANGYYKNNQENKYNYAILKVGKETTLNKPFEVKEVYELEQEARNMDKIKKIIKERVVK